jgi:pyridoxal phosphate enzyme (YggS family)
VSSVSVQENLSSILARIDAARKAAIAPAPSTTLVAVTKTQGAEQVRPALAAGHRVFGENRVQEAARKWPDLKSEHVGIELHLIGPLQTNKVKDAVQLFDVIETLDRPRLAHALAAEVARSGRSPRFFVQINTGEEPQKAGVTPTQASELLAICRDLNLSIAGLMCIPPIDQAPAPHFALLREIAKAHAITELSMGMSDDFETAIRFGATHVRIGTAIFGPRAQVDSGP